MPTFTGTYKAVRQSDAYKQAAAIAPVYRAMLFAYELWHPTLAAPVYFVNDDVDMTATIESTASRNAGTAQVFIGVRLAMQRPEESDSAGSPQVSLSREGISGVLASALATARGSLIPWELVERVYASDDLTGPAKLPVATYFLSAANLSAGGASVTAAYADPANVSVPRLTFRRESYPTLDF